jgi:starch phosphorylase
MWQRIWPERAPADVPIGHVTNGVHTTSWMALPMQHLLDRFLPDAWRTRVADPAVWEAIERIPDAELWHVRQQLRALMVREMRERSVADRLSRGESPDYVEAALRAFDPEALTIGFARRVATYKRLHLLTRHADRALQLLANTERPIQLVIAGKAHPADEEAKNALRGVFELRGAPNVARRVVFLEDYDLRVAPAIVAGVDLWLNLPRPPMEASGTSGMKVALNGGLNLSVLDGWWCEGFEPASGWAIDSRPGDPHAQDDLDAATLFSLVGGEVIPLFYERDAAGLPTRWLARVRASMQRLIPRFSADRMIRDYVATLYAADPPPSGGRPADIVA